METLKPHMSPCQPAEGNNRRAAFIRDMAARLLTATATERGSVGYLCSFDYQTCWAEAEAMWNAKPEGC